MAVFQTKKWEMKPRNAWHFYVKIFNNAIWLKKRLEPKTNGLATALYKNWWFGTTKSLKLVFHVSLFGGFGIFLPSLNLKPHFVQIAVSIIHKDGT